MTRRIVMSANEAAIVGAILDRFVSPDISVYVFGSRAGGKPKPWSDLDLVFESGARLPQSFFSALAEAFDESVLAWKVDLIDRAGASEQFGKIVDATKIPWEVRADA
jgi:predicted nucleotidyltransferase